jgi:hypothetical protein
MCVLCGLAAVCAVAPWLVLLNVLGRVATSSKTVRDPLTIVRACAMVTELVHY